MNARMGNCYFWLVFLAVVVSVISTPTTATHYLPYAGTRSDEEGRSRRLVGFNAEVNGFEMMVSKLNEEEVAKKMTGYIELIKDNSIDMAIKQLKFPDGTSPFLDVAKMMALVKHAGKEDLVNPLTSLARQLLASCGYDRLSTWIEEAKEDPFKREVAESIEKGLIDYMIDHDMSTEDAFREFKIGFNFYAESEAHAHEKLFVNSGLDILFSYATELNRGKQGLVNDDVKKKAGRKEVITILKNTFEENLVPLLEKAMMLPNVPKSVKDVETALIEDSLGLTVKEFFDLLKLEINDSDLLNRPLMSTLVLFVKMKNGQVDFIKMWDTLVKDNRKKLHTMLKQKPKFPQDWAEDVKKWLENYKSERFVLRYRASMSTPKPEVNLPLPLSPESKVQVTDISFPSSDTKHLVSSSDTSTGPNSKSPGNILPPLSSESMGRVDNLPPPSSESKTEVDNPTPPSLKSKIQVTDISSTPPDAKHLVSSSDTSTGPDSKSPGNISPPKSSGRFYNLRSLFLNAKKVMSSSATSTGPKSSFHVENIQRPSSELKTMEDNSLPPLPESNAKHLTSSSDTSTGLNPQSPGNSLPSLSLEPMNRIDLFPLPDAKRPEINFHVENPPPLSPDAKKPLSSSETFTGLKPQVRLALSPPSPLIKMKELMSSGKAVTFTAEVELNLRQSPSLKSTKEPVMSSKASDTSTETVSTPLLSGAPLSDSRFAIIRRWLLAFLKKLRAILWPFSKKEKSI
ncbi:hypothetical protein Plhal304r1_c034g0106861 [Plasmopara halstedii]